MLIVAETFKGVEVEALKAYVKKKYLECTLELHVVDQRMFGNWYKSFIEENELTEMPA